MADVAATLPLWSATAASNGPSGTTSVAAGLDDNLRELQKVVRGWLATKGADIASAATTDLGAIEGLSHTITVGGVTTVTSFGIISAGTWKVIILPAGLILTHNATSLILPGAANITTAAGDIAIVQSEGSGNWRCWSYIKASGLPIVNPTTVGPFSDANSLVENSSDGTKEVRVRAVNITTATTRHWWALDENMTIGNSWEIVNGSLAASVAANALTLSLKTKAGNDPSATDPVYVQFRSSTATDGKPVVREITAATSLVVSSGSALGTTNSQVARIYAGLADDAGTVRLFAYNPMGSTFQTLVGILESQLYSSTAEGGAGAADSAQVLYSGTAFTSKAVRLLGYVDISEATAGTWASSPTVVHTLNPGDPKTGDIIDTRRTADSAVATTSAQITVSDSIPTDTQGLSFLTQSITPKSGANLLRIRAQLTFSVNTNAVIVTSALFRDSSANAIATIWIFNDTTTGNAAREHVIQHQVSAVAATSATFSVRSGPSSSATITFNGAASARLYGGTVNSFIEVQEIHA